MIFISEPQAEKYVTGSLPEYKNIMSNLNTHHLDLRSGALALPNDMKVLLHLTIVKE